MMRSSGDFESLGEYIDQMQRIAVLLRSLGLAMLLTTLFNLGVVAVAAVGPLPPFVGLQMSALLFVVAVALLC